MLQDSGNPVRTINLLAAAIAIVVALAGPAIYFSNEYAHQASALATEAEINARIVDELISNNPEMWKFEEVRLAELLGRRPAKGHPEVRRIFDNEGNLVAQSQEMLAPPILLRSESIHDFGIAVGRIEISRSLRPLMTNTLHAALLAGLLGLAIFVVLRVLPLRALEGALFALSGEKERAQVTLRSIGDGVITTNVKGEIESLNRMAETLTGWKESDARGRPLEAVFRTMDGKTRNPCGHPLDEVRFVLTGGNPQSAGRRVVLIARDRTERLIEESAVPILGEGGNCAGAVLAFRDVTDRVRTEEELLKGKKLESLGILAGGIAHDFNNFLSGILGNISLAKLAVEPGSKPYGRLESAENAVSRAKELASKLLTFSKGGRPVRKPVHMEEIVKDSAYIAVMGSSCRCEFSFQQGLWPAVADAGQMGQVISNLVINAAQAMPGGGTVRIRMENAVVGESELRHVKAGDYVKIDVMDHGIGIPRENFEKIFDPYFTTKAKGNGLGLATSYAIMKSHGGNIFVESTTGVGTIFHLYAPAARDCIVARSVAAGEMAVAGKGRVLVMDDEEMILDVAGGMLDHLGYEPSLARDGSEAIRAYIKAEEAGRRFDAVIMDLTIPGGMGGEEAARKILEAYPDAKIIVSSGYSNDPVMASHARYGFRGVVVKPYRVEELSRVLCDVIMEEKEFRV
ncbi:MAG: ATP-binding protein [Deltaproteobacteria bacterium]